MDSNSKGSVGISQATAARFPLQLNVEYRHNYAREQESGVLKNISVSGAFVESPQHRFEVGEKIKLHFKLGDRKREIHATVVWSHSLGAGIRFAHHNNQDLQIVDDLIYYVDSKRSLRRDLLNNIFEQVIDAEEEAA